MHIRERRGGVKGAEKEKESKGKRDREGGTIILKQYRRKISKKKEKHKPFITKKQ